MSLLLRIFISGTIILVWCIWIYTSIFSWENTSFEDIRETYFTTDIWTTSFLSWSTHHTTLSSQEEIFFSAESSQVSDISWWLEIDISQNQKYFSSMRNIAWSYKFLGEWYEILQEGWWEIYIDSETVPWKTLLFSLNAPVILKLTSPDRSQTYTDIFLTPHMYIEFESSRGQFLQWADRLRVETIYKVWYLGESLGDEIWDEFLKKYVSRDNTFFHEIFSYISKNRESASEYISALRGKKVIEIPWIRLIKKYSAVFKNDEKKKIYYKNAILQLYIDILNVKKYDTSLLREIESVQGALKAFDIESYNEIQSLLSFLQWEISRDSNPVSISAKTYFAHLWWEIVQWDEQEYMFHLHAYSLYSIYDDSGSMWFRVFREYLSSFLLSYAWRGVYDEYFVFFLEKYLLFDLSPWNKRLSLVESLTVLWVFHEIAEKVYSETVTSKITWMYIYNNILYNISLYARDEYFLSERNQQDILVLDEKTSISNTAISLFKQRVDDMFDFFLRHENLLEDTKQRDVNIKKGTQKMRLQFDEYFSALENYWVYAAKYDETKQNAVWVKTFGSQDEDILSRNTFLEYMSQFVWVSGESIDFQIVDDFYYKVNSVVIRGTKMSFDMYPYQGNIIKNIYISGEEKLSQYRLDDVQERWDEQYQFTPEEEREVYDFSRFFIITFLQTSQNFVDEYEIKPISQDEDRSEIVFKRDKLLWENGEFEFIKDILLIEYDDIRLEKRDNTYDIFISDAELNITSSSVGSSLKYTGKFASRYSLTDTDHYFTNAQASWEKDSWSTKTSYFSGNPMIFSWKLELVDFSSIMNIVSLSLPIYERVYDELQKISPRGEFVIEYIPSNQKLLFKLDSWWKRYTIIIFDNQVEQILESNKKLLSSPVPLTLLSKYIAK